MLLKSNLFNISVKSVFPSPCSIKGYVFVTPQYNFLSDVMCILSISLICLVNIVGNSVQKILKLKSGVIKSLL